MKTGIELIAEERQEQIEKHGRTIEADAAFNYQGQLMFAVSQLIRPDSDMNAMEKALGARGFTTPLGWDANIFSKMMGKPYKERKIIAAALIAADIDREQYE